MPSRASSLTALCLLAFTLGCRKEADIAPAGNLFAAHNGSQNISANYPFDWESATQMPAASGTTPISMPWMSQSGNYIDPAILSDYHKADGWDLVYDSFGPNVVPTKDQQPAGGLYFALYNRFRGLLRYYLYVPPGYFGSSTQLAHGLGVFSDNSTPSKMLNFEVGDVVDALNNARGFTKTSTQSVNATGGWYAMQYEIAYDPAFASTAYPHLGFTWDVSSVSVTNISLNGVEQGTLQGTITTPAPGFADAVVNGAFSVAEIYGISGGFKGKIKDAANGGIAGSLTGFLSGIIGGNSANSQEVDLKLSSTITTKGTATTSQAFQKNSFIFPGQQSLGGNSPAPLINYQLGLFNVLDTPTVTVHTIENDDVDFPGDPQGYGRGDRYDNLYYVDVAQLESMVKFNGSVIGNGASSGATYSNFSAEVILFDPVTSPNSIISSGTFEQIGQQEIYSGNPVVSSNTVSRFDSQLDPTNQVVGVRLHFRVKPNNNAPESVIVKTFLAKLKVV